MRIILKDFITQLGLSTILIFCLYLVFGLYYEEYTDVVFTIIYKGIFVGQSDNLVNNYGALTGIGQIYKYLYGINNSLPWYGIFSIFYSILILGNLIIISKLLFSRLEIKNNYKTIISVAIPFILLFHYYALFQITKITFTLGISIIILLLFNYYKKITFSKGAIAYIAFCLIIDSMLRAEALFLLVLFFGVTTVCSLGIKETFLLSLRVYIIPIVISLLALFLSTQTYTDADVEYNKISAYKVGAWDGGIDPTKIHFETKNDSIKYAAFCNFLLSDRDSVNLPLLTKYSIDAYDKKGNFLSNITHNFPFRLQHGFFTLYISFRVAGFFTIVMLFANLLLLLSIIDKKARTKFILANAAFIASIIFVAIVIKMEERVLVPLMLGQTLLCYLFFYPYLVFAKKRTTILLSICGLFILIQFSRKVEYLIEKKTEYNTIINSYPSMVEQCKNKTLVFNLFSCNVLAPGVLTEDKLACMLRDNNVQVLCLDNGYIALHQTYIDYMNKMVGSAHYTDITRYLNNHKNDVYYISPAKRHEFITNYFNTIYGANFKPGPVKYYNGITCYFTGESTYYLYRNY